jgi:hypothetical protein
MTPAEQLVLLGCVCNATVGVKPNAVTNNSFPSIQAYINAGSPSGTISFTFLPAFGNGFTVSDTNLTNVLNKAFTQLKALG